MQIIPTSPVPSQMLTTSLAGQSCQIKVYQKTTGLYIDLSVNDVLIIGGVIALNANLIVRDSYLGFIGDLAFFDTQDSEDPDYTGLGSRFILAYIEKSERAT